MKFNQKKISIILVSVLATAGCVPAGKKFAVEFKDPSVFSNLKLDVSSVQVQNNQLIVRGSGLKDIKTIKLINNGVTESLVVESASSGQLVANGLSAVAIGVGKVFDMVLADAYGSATVPVTFTLENGSITAAHLNNMGAVSGQVLKYNGVVWEPSTLSSSQIYQGVWDADTNTPNLNLTSPVSGEYYIVSVAGTYNSVSYDVGDWIIHNGTSWDKVVSSAASKLSLSGGTLTGNLQLDTLLKFKGAANYVTLKASSSLASDITLVLPKTVGTSGQFLTTDGTGVMSWTTPADPVIANLNASQIADGSVSNTAFQYLAGATSNIQAQLNAKQATGNFVTALTGDVTASGAGSVAATVVQVGGVSAANIATGANLANSATNANTASTAVKRDASGNFSAGTITATLNGTATNVSGVVAVANGGTGSSSLALNQLLYGNGTSAINGLATTGVPSVLLSAFGSGAPEWTTSTPGNVLKSTVSGVAFGTLASSDLPAGTLSGSGTENYIPYYNTTSTFANSPMAISGSNVGIGTTTPAAALDISNGAIALLFGAEEGLTTRTNSTLKKLRIGSPHYLTAQSPASVIVGINGPTSNQLFFGGGTASMNAATQLSFYTAATSTTTTGTERVRIDGSGNVGIGTTSPSSALHVSSPNYPPFRSERTTTSTANRIGTAQFVANSNGTIVDGFGSHIDFLIRGDAAVDNNIASIGAMRSGADNSGGIYFMTSNAGTMGQRMRIDPSGNVGIGTTAPGSTLEVKGTLRLSGSTSGYVGFAPAAAAGTTTYLLPATQGSAGQILSTDGVATTPTLSWVTPTAAPVTSVNTLTGAVVLTTTNIAEGTNLYATNARTIASTLTGFATGANSTILSSDSVLGAFQKTQGQIDAKESAITAGSTAQYIRGDKSLSTFASDVWATVLTGLSTATNSAITAADSVLAAFGKLQAQVTTLTALDSNKLSKNTADSITAIITVSGAGDVILPSTPAGMTSAVNKTYVDTAITNNGVWSKSGSTVNYTAGNVGIGTTTPSSLLDVGGTLSLNDGTSKVHSIIPNISVNGTARTLRFSDSSTVANEGYQFYNSNTSTSLMMIQQNGNVGIGTTAPVSKLNIQDASGNSPIQLITSGGLIGDSLYMTANGRSRFGYDGARLAVSIGDYSSLGTSAGKPIVLDTGGSERVRIDTSGNVGIGTASPSSLLHLASASPYTTYEETDTTQKFFSGVDGSRYWLRQGSTGNPDLLTLLSNGNFGIGATSPSQLLSVGSNQFTVSSSGAVAATSVSVPSFSSLTLSSSLTNSSFILPSSSNGSVLAYSPASKVMWHDRLAFSKAFGAPTFEVFNGSWSAGTLDAGLFSKQENRAIQQIDGVTNTAARWTWNHSSISYSSVEWWAMGFTYTATASAKNILIESSADGVTWTSRHTSTGNMANQSVVLFNMSTNGSETYLRLTITVTNGQPLVMSSIRALSARWGNQGGGSEQEYPYVWDSAQRIAFGSNASAANGVVTVGTSTTAASGGIYFGPDTNLYRLGANSLRTDGAFSMGGNVGIGTTSPSYKLHVVGAGGATVGYFSDGTATCSITPATAGNISCSSDERLKKSVKAFSDSLSLENVLKLKTVTYEWKNINNGRHTGYIAQELEKIAPEFVTTGKDGFKQVSYTGLIPWITGAIKAFYGEFKALTTRVMSLEEKDKAKDRVIASVKAESVQLKKDNELLKLENKAIKSYLCSRDPKAGICK